MGRAEVPVIYGEDGRLDVYELDDPGLRSLAIDSTVALAYTSRLVLGDDGKIGFEATSLGERHQLCPEERFADQPVLPFCSGVLVDDDLVLTAGHCFTSRQRSAEDVCRATSFLFGFYRRAPDELADISASEVFGCRRLIAYSQSDSDPRLADYALVQLDRAAASKVPVEVRTQFDDSAELVGARLHLIGNGGGVPTKVDSGGRVVGTYAPAYVVTDTDSFESGSGSAVFHEARSLLAIQVRGNADWERGLNCTRAARSEDGKEHHLLASVALTHLCDGAYPSARLCSRAPWCGDGVCSVGESDVDCSADCLPPCGDAVCLPTERENCAEDCASTIVPAGWWCAPWSYGDGASCDCRCGLPDPDCETPAAATTGCAFGESCSLLGACVLAAGGAGEGSARSSPAPDASSSCALMPARRGPARPWLVIGLSSLLTLRSFRRGKRHNQRTTTE